ncbi:MAG TPA: hypothetical protein VN026_09845 [Bacteroidia bacterium]|jgi:Tfp pilus assembly protein PilP|nr:hypothetical protein [Bacteroidia bacterium]
MALGKKTLYYVVPINLVLWGYIGYKIYTWGKDEVSDNPTEKAFLPAKFDKDSNNYQLALNYPDPFLKNEIEKQKNYSVKNNSKSPKPKEKKIAPVEKADEIKYMGLVSNQSSGVTTALVSVNGKSYVVKKGETIEGMLIKSITQETLELKVGKELVLVKK